jgi:hypothetical protein
VKCTSPLPAYRLANGDVVFVERGNVVDYIELACGKCLSCRINRSEDWATRIMHEAKMHDHTCFVTLTYSSENLPNPPSLNHKHFQLFMYRLRQKFKNVKIRYFMCGEYGTDLCRPHYHAALFGVDFLADRRPCGGSGDRTLFESPTLNSLWQLGYCPIGTLTRESAAYIARYIVDKKFISIFSPIEIKDHYKRVDLNTGEIKDLAPEYIRMSLKPGIGGAYYVKYGGDIYPADNVIIDGQPRKVPRYYDKLKAREDKDLIERVKMARHERAKEHVDDNSNEMLAMQDEWLRHSMKTTKQRLL